MRSGFAAFLAIFKELRHITRDVRIFFLVTLSPAFLLFVLAYIFAFDMGNVSLGWLDGDRTPPHAVCLAAITADGTFRLAQDCRQLLPSSRPRC